MKTKFVHVSNEIYLGSAQKEALSSSGTISVTFKYLAIVTMSHICREDPEVRHKQQRTNKKLHAYRPMRCSSEKSNLTLILIAMKVADNSLLLAFGLVLHCRKPLDNHCSYIPLQTIKTHQIQN
jgi:hypothetical protein